MVSDPAQPNRSVLATTESYLDKSNTRQERTEWHSVTVWGKRGEALAKFLTKGSNIFVEGSLRTSSYEKDGEKRYRTEIVANNILLTGGRGKSDGASRDDAGGGGNSWGGGGGGGASRGGGSRPPARETPADAGGFDEFAGGGAGGSFDGGEDEIPF